MALNNLIMDSIKYPIKNIKALLIYLVLGLLVGIVAVLTGIGSISTGSFNFGSGVILGIVGIVIVVLIYLLILGFSLDVIKLGIKRSENGPEIDLQRQVGNGLKYLIVSIVYLIIPILIMVILGVVFQHWVVYLIGIILNKLINKWFSDNLFSQGHLFD